MAKLKVLEEKWPVNRKLVIEPAKNLGLDVRDLFWSDTLFWGFPYGTH